MSQFCFGGKMKNLFMIKLQVMEVINKLIMAENELKFPSANYYADGMHVTVNS